MPRRMALHRPATSVRRWRRRISATRRRRPAARPGRSRRRRLSTTCAADAKTDLPASTSCLAPTPQRSLRPPRHRAPGRPRLAHRPPQRRSRPTTAEPPTLPGTGARDCSVTGLEPADMGAGIDDIRSSSRSTTGWPSSACGTSVRRRAVVAGQRGVVDAPRVRCAGRSASSYGATAGKLVQTSAATPGHPAWRAGWRWIDRRAARSSWSDRRTLGAASRPTCGGPSPRAVFAGVADPRGLGRVRPRDGGPSAARRSCSSRRADPNGQGG